jgi:hypothetical protein
MLATVLHSFPRLIQWDAMIVPWNRPQSLPLKSLHTHYLQSSHLVWCYITSAVETVSLDNLNMYEPVNQLPFFIFYFSICYFLSFKVKTQMGLVRYP